MGSSSYPPFDPQIERIDEFLERFTVQNGDLLAKAGDNELKKAAVLCRALPVHVITDLQRRCKPMKLSAATYEQITATLLAQYKVKKSVVGAAVRFLNRKQQNGESIESYAKTLNNLAAECDYKACCHDRLLRDIFVSGLCSSAIVTKLLQECDEAKPFNDYVTQAKLLEQLTNDAYEMSADSNHVISHKVYSTRNRNQDKASSEIPVGYVCMRCGADRKHLAKNCWAITVNCRKCGKSGHIARVCKAKTTHSVREPEIAMVTSMTSDNGNYTRRQPHSKPMTSSHSTQEYLEYSGGADSSDSNANDGMSYNHFDDSFLL